MLMTDTPDPVDHLPIGREMRADESAPLFGYRFGGLHPGPSLLIATQAPLAEAIRDRLEALPTLPWMRGTICLVILDVLDGLAADRHYAALSTVRIDRVLVLPLGIAPDGLPKAAQNGYREILRFCTKLGMIDGRGVH